MTETARDLLQLSYPIDEDRTVRGEEWVQEAHMRLLCERAEAALDGHSALLRASEKLRGCIQSTKAALRRPGLTLGLRAKQRLHAALQPYS